MEKPITIRYSTRARPTWVRAVILIPMIAMTPMTTTTAVPMPTYAHELAELLPNTASTDGPSTSTPATVPMM